MSGRKKVKKKRIEPKVAKKADVIEQDKESKQPGITESAFPYWEKLQEAIECLKHYTKKDQIGELANRAIELLAKWGISD